VFIAPVVVLQVGGKDNISKYLTNYKWDEIKWAYSGSHCWIVGPNVKDFDVSAIKSDCMISIDDSILKVVKKEEPIANVWWHFNDWKIYLECADKLKHWNPQTVITNSLNAERMEEEIDGLRMIVMSYPRKDLPYTYSATETAFRAAVWLGFRTFFLLGIEYTKKARDALLGLKTTVQYVKIYDCDCRSPLYKNITFEEAITKRELI